MIVLMVENRWLQESQTPELLTSEYKHLEFILQEDG